MPPSDWRYEWGLKGTQWAVYRATYRTERKTPDLCPGESSESLWVGDPCSLPEGLRTCTPVARG